MYALSVSGAVNMQGFVWSFFMRYVIFFIHSFIHFYSVILGRLGSEHLYVLSG